ncbi:coilin-like [Saccostrea echinata]|uniref:coilin-like n=1 Tax=Saccostrea echinata TaxID=191078 RepID=UPI002A823A60|nr:coilin-like [Saccostrea echinata]
MSASMEEVPVRVKLFFDNLSLPCSWVLVKTKKCPKVKDFLSYVRRKFMPQRDGSLSILINGCTVPEWEKSSIFREDDIVHLYFKEITHVSMVSDRLITPEEYAEIYNKDKDLRKKKKSKEESSSIQSKETERKGVEDVMYISGDEEHQTKKKRKISTEKHETLEDEDMTPDRSTNHTEDTVKPDKKKRTRKRKRRREEAAPAATVSNNSINVKPLRQQVDLNSNMHIKFTSDNEEEQSCTMLDSSRTQEDALQQEEESLRTSTPVYHKHGDQTVDLTYSESPSAIDRPTVTQSVLANGVAVFSRPRSRQIKSNSFRELTKEQQLSTKLTNRSFVLQNTSLSNGKEESAPLTCPQRSSSNASPVIAIPVRREYQQFPLLQGSPNPGDKIAFKMLEMSENYTPEVGDYKEAEVVSFNSSSQIVEMKISPGFNKERTLGKFDVDLNDEETDMDSEETMVETHPLTSLMEVRLITE